MGWNPVSMGKVTGEEVGGARQRASSYRTLLTMVQTFYCVLKMVERHWMVLSRGKA